MRNRERLNTWVWGAQWKLAAILRVHSDEWHKLISLSFLGLWVGERGMEMEVGMRGSSSKTKGTKSITNNNLCAHHTHTSQITEKFTWSWVTPRWSDARDPELHLTKGYPPLWAFVEVDIEPQDLPFRPQPTSPEHRVYRHCYTYTSMYIKNIQIYSILDYHVNEMHAAHTDESVLLFHCFRVHTRCYFLIVKAPGDKMGLNA